MFRFLSLSLFIWWCGVSLSHGQSISLAEGHDLQYRGEIFAQSWYFPSKGLSSQMPDVVNTLGAEADISYLTPWNLNFKLHPRVAIDPSDPQLSRYGTVAMGEGRSRLYLEEAYLDWFEYYFFELRAGLQTLNWKMVESYSWMDFINQIDQEVDLFSPEKLPELIIKSRFTLPIDIDNSLEVLYIPVFQSGTFPREDNRYDALGSQNFRYEYDPDQMTYSDSLKVSRYQFAFKWNSILFESIDYSLLYFNGYERLPFTYPIRPPSEAQKGVVTSHFEAVEKLGLSFVTEVGSWLVKGEGVANRFQKPVRFFNQNTSSYERRDFNPWLGYTFGIEYTIYEALFQGQDLGLIVEMIGHTAEEELPLFLPFKNHAFAGMRYTFNNASDRSILLGSFVSYTKLENVISLEYEERLGTHFRLKAGGFLLAGEESSELSIFENSSRIQSELSYFF